MALFFFDLVRRLPEEQVRRDRGPENREQHGDVLLVCPPFRCECGVEHFAPGRPDDECDRDIRKQGERGQLDVSRERGVVRSRGEYHDGRGEEDNEQERRNTREHLACVGHSAEIGPDIEHIRCKQRRTGHVHEWPRIVAFERARQAGSRDETDTGTGQFDGVHQGEREHRRPQCAETEAGARHRVRRDSGRVVI